MWDLMWSIDFWPEERERSIHAPFAPLRENAVRISFPRPRAAPVTAQVLPSREKEGRVMRLREGTVGIGRRRALPYAARRTSIANAIVSN